MGCAASNNNTFEQKALIIDESASLKDTTGSVASTTSKSACDSPFCEFDDEFREIRRSRTESMETALTAVVSYNALQQPALDLPCVITDEEFITLRSSVIATDEEEPKQEIEVQTSTFTSANPSIAAILLGARLVATPAAKGPEGDSDIAAACSPEQHIPFQSNEGPLVIEAVSVFAIEDDAEPNTTFVPFSSSKDSFEDGDSQKAVRTIVNKIEVEALERKNVVIVRVAEAEFPMMNGRSARSLGLRSKSEGGLLPLSPTKFAPRSIASIGKVTGEKTFVGGQDQGRVKDIVEKFSSPSSTPVKSHSNLNGFFKPMPTRSDSIARRLSEAAERRVAFSDEEDGEGETENELSETDKPGRNSGRRRRVLDQLALEKRILQAQAQE